MRPVIALVGAIVKVTLGIFSPSVSGMVTPRPLTPRCRYSAGVNFPPTLVATMHQPPACRFEKVNFPSCPVFTLKASGGFAKLLQSIRRNSTDAPGTGAPDPIATTVPDIAPVPGGSGCGGAPGNCGFCDRGAFCWASSAIPIRTSAITSVEMDDFNFFNMATASPFEYERFGCDA